MLQALINLFKPYKKAEVEVKVEDTVKVEAPTPVEAKVEPAPEIKTPLAPTPVQAHAPKANKGRPKGSKPAAKPGAVKPQRKKK